MNTSMKARIGGYLGSTVGILGWIIGFTIFCLATGHTGALREALVPGLLGSLAIAAVFILVLEATIRLYGAAHPMFHLNLWGLLLSGMGGLTFVVNHWLAPIIDRHPELAEQLQRAGSVYRVSDTLPIALLAAGVVLLAISVTKMVADGAKNISKPPQAPS